MGVAQQRTGTMLQPGLVTSWAFWGPESWPRSKRAKKRLILLFLGLARRRRHGGDAIVDIGLALAGPKRRGHGVRLPRSSIAHRIRDGGLLCRHSRGENCHPVANAAKAAVVPLPAMTGLPQFRLCRFAL